MKHFFIATLLLLSSLCMQGQTTKFGRLDVALTAGSTGFGIEVATPLYPWMELRGGFSFLPNFRIPMTMHISKTKSESQMDLDKLSETFENITGYELKREIGMDGRINFWNANLMLDFRPFENKRWRLTAGLSIGSNHLITEKNIPECMSTLLSVGVYNHYSQKVNDPQVISGEEPLFSFKGMEIYLFGDKIYIEYGDLSTFKESETINNLRKYGEIGITLGERSNGEPYRLVPNEEGIVEATVKVNSVKPYIGFGYDGQLSKKSDKYLIGFDCGVMFWGGVPDIIMNDGTNLTHDISNYPSQIAHYCYMLKSLPVYPVANVRLTRRIDFNKK